jgi:hypothetical protein
MSSKADELDDFENRETDDEASHAAAGPQDEDDRDVTDVIDSHAPDTDPVHPDHRWAAPLSPGQVIEYHWQQTFDGDES